MAFLTPDKVFGKGSSELPTQFVGMEFNLPPQTADDFDPAFLRKTGQEVSRAAYNQLWLKAQFLGWVQSEANWQAAKGLSPNGSVSFYSDGDGSSTFRLPTSGDEGGFSRELGEGNAPALGDIELGFQDQIQNITGQSSASSAVGLLRNDSNVNAKGAFVVGDEVNYRVHYDPDGVGYTLDFDASRVVRAGDETSPKGNYVKTFIYTGSRGTVKPVSSLEQLLSVAAQPRVLHNTDMTNPVNQIGFDGDWDGLAVDEQGWDLWRKYDGTRMFQVVEEGSYRPNQKYILQADDVVIWEGISPASGHWGIAIPNTSDKIDLRMGEVKVPWHPEDTESKLAKCQIQYWETTGLWLYSLSTDGAGVNSLKRRSTVHFSTTMRGVPEVTSISDQGPSIVISKTVNHCTVEVEVGGNTVGGQLTYLLADATLKQADVASWTVI